MSFAARPTVKPTVEKRRTCSQCGRLGHLVSTCTNHERYHDMIGIEIEGWWFDLPGVITKATELTGNGGNRDGSLRDISSCAGSDEDEDFDDPDTEDCEEGCDDCPHPIERRGAIRCGRAKENCKSCGARGWEFQTKPGSVGEALRQLTQLYPEVTSRSAGMHVHMSFKEQTSVSLLCSEAFFKYWQERWEKWGTKNNIQGVFWERLRNENQYCRPTAMEDYNPKDIVTQNKGGRYKAINFLAYDEHKTVEFRLLPMFQKGNLAVASVEQLVDIVETFLQNHKIDTDVQAPPTKFPKTPDEPLLMEPVDLDFEVPIREFPVVSAEVDLDFAIDIVGGKFEGEKLKPGPVLDKDGKPTGAVRMFRYQVDNYYTTAAADAADKKTKIADPKRSKVKWETFDVNPTGTVR